MPASPAGPRPPGGALRCSTRAPPGSGACRTAARTPRSSRRPGRSHTGRTSATRPGRTAASNARSRAPLAGRRTTRPRAAGSTATGTPRRARGRPAADPRASRSSTMPGSWPAAGCASRQASPRTPAPPGAAAPPRQPGAAVRRTREPVISTRHRSPPSSRLMRNLRIKCETMSIVAGQRLGRGRPADQRSDPRCRLAIVSVRSSRSGFGPGAKPVTHRRQYASAAIRGGPGIRDKPAALTVSCAMSAGQRWLAVVCMGQASSGSICQPWACSHARA